MATENENIQDWQDIRDEIVNGANTATRVGTAGEDTAQNLKDKTVESFDTTENDTALVLKPDGSGGVEWGADSVGTDTREFSLQCTRSGNVSASAFLRVGGLTMDAGDMAMIIPIASTLYVLSIGRTDTDNADIEVLKNGVVVETVNTTAVATVSGVLTTSFAAGDHLAVRNKSTSNTMSNVNIILTFEHTI